MEDNTKKRNFQPDNTPEGKDIMVSSMEEMFAILEGKAISYAKGGKKKTFYLKEHEEVEVAHQIAEMYIQQFPRPQYYPAHLTSSEDASELTLYHKLTKEEIAIIQEFNSDTEYDEGELEDYLRGKGHQDLLDKLLEHDTPMQLDTLSGCNLNAPEKFTDFSVQYKEEDGSLSRSFIYGCPLSDDEFIELLEQCLLKSNRISMNMLVYRKADVAQRIIRHLVWVFCDYNFETTRPFICELDELKSVAQSILDPSKDILKLSDSNDLRIRAFMKGHKIEKERKEE